MERQRTAPLTRRGLKITDALLVGKLVLRTEQGRNHLGIKVWCPHCRLTHSHGFDDPPFRFDRVSHRVAHCPAGSPLNASGYYIGLDPTHAGHNRAVVAQCRASLPENAIG